MVSDINKADIVYLNMAKNLIDKGVVKKDRTGTGTISLFAVQMRFDLNDGFPLLTTKRIPFRVVAEELFWFLSGSTDLQDLLTREVNIWNKDAYRFYKANSIGTTMGYDEFINYAKNYGFDLGKIYGANWRNFNGDVKVRGIDQITEVVNSIKDNPDSRRHIVTSWNPSNLNTIVLPSCHVLFQFYVSNNKLSCHLYQRSGDFFLGVPFNIASYGLLTHLIANTLGLGVGEFVHTIGDAHIYLNHLNEIGRQITREPKNTPTLKINKIKNKVQDYSIEDVEILNYNPHPSIKGDLSVGD